MRDTNDVWLYRMDCPYRETGQIIKGVVSPSGGTPLKERHLRKADVFLLGGVA